MNLEDFLFRTLSLSHTMDKDPVVYYRIEANTVAFSMTSQAQDFFISASPVDIWHPYQSEDLPAFVCMMDGKRLLPILDGGEISKIHFRMDPRVEKTMATGGEFRNGNVSFDVGFMNPFTASIPKPGKFPAGDDVESLSFTVTDTILGDWKRLCSVVGNVETVTISSLDDPVITMKDGGDNVASMLLGVDDVGWSGSSTFDRKRVGDLLSRLGVGSKCKVTSKYLLVESRYEGIDVRCMSVARRRTENG